MANEIDIFKTQLPAHAQGKSKAMEAMGSGLSGGGFGNRISLRGSRFRLIQNGENVGTVPTPHLDVVIFALAQSLQRIYYIKPYNPDDPPSAPDCFSHDGITPSPESPHKQSEKCNICTQNVKGSAKQGNGKACSYKKRAILLPENLEGAPYALDINGQSMFGEQIDSANKFNFKGYFEKLSAHHIAIDAVVTRLTFDDAASVPKLHFSPLRVLTKEEYDLILERADDPDVAKMLKDLTNDVEVEVETPKPVATPTPVAPKVVATPATPKVKGFAVESVAPAAIAAQANGGGTKTKTLDIDFKNLTKFDD